MNPLTVPLFAFTILVIVGIVFQWRDQRMRRGELLEYSRLTDALEERIHTCRVVLKEMATATQAAAKLPTTMLPRVEISDMPHDTWDRVADIAYALYTSGRTRGDIGYMLELSDLDVERMLASRDATMHRNPRTVGDVTVTVPRVPVLSVPAGADPLSTSSFELVPDEVLAAACIVCEAAAGTSCTGVLSREILPFPHRDRWHAAGLACGACPHTDNADEAWPPHDALPLDHVLDEMSRRAGDPPFGTVLHCHYEGCWNEVDRYGGLCDEHDDHDRDDEGPDMYEGVSAEEMDEPLANLNDPRFRRHPKTQETNSDDQEQVADEPATGELQPSNVGS